MVRRRSRSRDWGAPATPVWPGGGGDRRRSCGGGAELERLPTNMAAAAEQRQQQLLEASAAVAPLPLSSGGGSSGSSGSVPVLFCFSVFARPSTVPHGSGYEMLIQKFLSLYGDQLDMHRKFVVQLFSEEWSQYIDLPKGFLVNERCKLRLVPLQIQVGDGGKGTRARAPGVHVCVCVCFVCLRVNARTAPPWKSGSIIEAKALLPYGAQWEASTPTLRWERRR